MIRIGLIGCGAVASFGHIPAIIDTDGLQLHALLDTDPAQLIQAQSRFSVPHIFTDIDLFFQSGIDAVVITSPAPVHFAHVQAAAKYKKPALCEKPLAMDEAQASEMIAMMDAANLPLYVGFTYRFAPVAMDIRRLVREGAIGEVKSLRLAYVWDCHGKYAHRADPASGIYDRRHGRMIEGGPMVDCGVHQIDLARWWTGSEVTRVTGHGAWVDTGGYEAPDHVYLHMDHENGAHTMVEISYSYAHTSRDSRCEFYYELIGTEGIIRYNRQSRYFELVNKHGTQHFHWTEEKNFHGMYHAFKNALTTGQAGDMPTAKDGLRATVLARQATEDAAKWRKG
ncbi:MAG: Gfo/Idh/MocA family oxidoreductase [Burkholderiales bacterium]|nr:Gfo/Idh/MocA family oxidoreductase [Phycisphaerae bacterium]